MPEDTLSTPRSPLIIRTTMSLRFVHAHDRATHCWSIRKDSGNATHIETRITRIEIRIFSALIRVPCFDRLLRETAESGNSILQCVHADAIAGLASQPCKLTSSGFTHRLKQRALIPCSDEPSVAASLNKLERCPH